MEKNPDIAKGFTKRDKPLVDSLWQELTESLNSIGPPTKDVNGWKKTWTEWKSEIKKKMAHNKMEQCDTGGGPFSKYTLNQMEENINNICGMVRSVEGVSGISIGIEDKFDDETDDEIPSNSSKRKLDEPSILVATPKKPKFESSNERLAKYLEEDTLLKGEANHKLDKLISIQKENASNLRRVYRAVEKGNESVAKAINEFSKEFVSLSSLILKAIQEKNEIKRQQVELDILKFNYEKEKNEL